MVGGLRIVLLKLCGLTPVLLLLVAQRVNEAHVFLQEAKDQ
jgi:hypothetical protein